MNRYKSIRRWGEAMAVPLIGVSVMLTGIPAVQAATVATDFSDPTFKSGRQLSDSELAQLRGKAVNSREVLFFGVEMSTSWKTSLGEDIHARANLGINMASGRPSPTFSSHITSTTPEEYAAYQQSVADSSSVNGMGLSNGRGIVQLVQAGGDFNTANNAFWVDVGGGTGRDSSQPANGKTELSQGGALVKVGRQAGGIGMTMTVPGAGVVSQDISPGRGLHQAIQLTSDHQQISNMTRLSVQLGNVSESGINRNLKNVLKSVRALDRL
ncbi:hypothetical protein SAMN04487958_101519 [Vreelandella subterranea]|uniref:Uncharacterized protein n=1 Tax=Vreelandella subterranea TaxID=416874 RepID=A0A1H9Q2S4_9GAMM|nr:hypothetical protein [Halomonas subterranea]SER54714.1 hypothetical protein SAMN04487958_101519 [Halomonas subterranea]